MAVLTQPPGPKNPLVLGHLRPFRRDPLSFLSNVARVHGDISYFRLGNQDIYFLNHPDLIKDVLVNQQSNFRKSRILQRAKVLLGEGLLTSEGQFHLRQRRLAQPAFHRDRLTGYADSMIQLAEKMASQWRDGEIRDIHQEMTGLTLAIVGKTLFSADVEEEARAVGRAMTEVLGLFDLALLPFSELLIKLPLGAPRRFHKAKAELDAIIYRIIEERRRSGEDKGDLLSMLILAQDEEEGTGGMTDQQIRDEALTLFLAGHETTANALTWAWYLLSGNPEVEARLHAEVDRVLGDRPARMDDLPQLGYVQNVFAESMRLYPPAWAVGRMTLREVQLGGFTVPAGVIVIMSPYVMHRDPRFWEQAEMFRPERFEGGRERPKFSYFPFGGGTRACIGERFAWMEGVLALATLSRLWKLRMIDAKPVLPRPQITLRPRTTVRMRMEKR